MSDFQCKFYLLDGAETLEYKEGDAEYVIKIAGRPFPDSRAQFTQSRTPALRRYVSGYSPGI